jgi:hypothetical protein
LSRKPAAAEWFSSLCASLSSSAWRMACARSMAAPAAPRRFLRPLPDLRSHTANPINFSPSSGPLVK